MLSKHAIRALRGLHKTIRNPLLSTSFSLDAEWTARHAALSKLGLGGDYEWISAVQKKFIGGGYASAVDVDAAVCVAEQKDQVDDVIELIYKLRHSVKAAEKLESSEYALVRLLLKYQPETILTLANDPINYGVFLNPHLACIVIDHFIKASNIQAAARIVTWMVQQEELDNELLNVLGLYVCAKWAELPGEQQTLELGEKEEEEDVNDDDIRTFKFPYLKNEHFDEHFDLTNPHHLVGKSMMWLSRDTSSIDKDLKSSFNVLGAVLFQKLSEALPSASTAIPSVKRLIAEQLKPKEGEEQPDEEKKILEAIGEIPAANEKLLSDIILEHLKTIQASEEEKLCASQTTLFATWNERRQELAKSQAQKVLLRVRQDEIRAELKQLDEQEEQMSFFKNRLAWEKRAAENTQIEEESKQRHKKREAAV
uniref:28S ribosomal protein S27, mitochondrial n=1 Tax=Caenorhabditis tropicalis TaxID=1561998 RepID=A0A1I7TAM6_9PELO